MTPKFSSILSERSQPGVTPTTVTGLFSELGVEALDDSLDVGLDEVVVEAHVPPELGIRLRRAVGHLHDEARASVSRRGPQHERDRGATRDQVRVHAHLQHPQPAGPVVLPERLVPFHVPVAAEDVVDEDVEPALVALDAFDQLGNRGRVFVIDHERRPRASRGRHQLSGLLDRLGPADL